MKDTKKKYLENKSLFKGDESSSAFFPIAVCIPAYNEYPTIIKTLQSLAVSSAICSIKVDVVICINNRESTSIEVKQNNQYCVEVLRRIAKNEFFVDESSPSGVRITVLDYTENKMQFTQNQGVGYARKIAMDYALSRGAKVLACLDADTLVSEDYCGELSRFYKEKMDFATLDFFHQQAESVELQEAINQYEFWMKDHSARLKDCGTPFHYSALGSLIVVSDTLYCEVGGMKNRLAGEDFYFIQESIKILLSRLKNLSLESLPYGNSGEVDVLLNPVPILNSTVFPEPRISDRVLFGTGKSINQISDGRKKVRYYLDSSYELIADFISLFNDLNEKGLAASFPQEALCLNEKLSAFLESDRFFENWDKMIQTTKNNKLKNAVSFHCKFDGLKIIRAIHFIEN